MFQRAVKKNEPLRLALLGPAGSGKSFSSLKIATHIAQGGMIAAIDTERGSLKKYAPKTGQEPDGKSCFLFDFIEPKFFGADVFTNAIQEAERAGYACLIIDSLSHAWMGPGGVLEFKEEVQRRNRGTNDYTAWREATPEHNRLVNAMMNCRLHLIVTMRTKMEHVVEKDERTGKTTVRKIGMQPVQRDGLEYEFDVVGDMDGGTLSISKSRCDEVSGKAYRHPGAELGAILLDWCGWTVGMPVTQTEAPVPPAPAPAPPAPAPTGPSQEATDAFAAACAAASRDPRAESAAMIAYFGAQNWAHLTDADLAAYPATWAAVLAPVNTATHPDFIRFRTVCEFAGVNWTDAMAALLTEHNTTETAALPAGAILRRASEIETAALPAAQGFQV